VSPRRLDPKNRIALLDIAARLISQDGPTALSTRRLAAEAGTSTMAVYTYFGSMREVVREVVREGFARLQRAFDHVEPSQDPVDDLALYGRVYRHNALANRHVFEVMFGGSSLAGFALSDDDRQHGRYTLAPVVTCADRCITAGRLRGGDAALTAHQMWLGVHGVVTLEIGGYLVEPYDADRCFEAQLTSLMVGAGDELTSASASVARSRERFSAGFALGNLQGAQTTHHRPSSKGGKPGPLACQEVDL
jgi:AcrR family transcriptional regulator